MKVKRWHKNAYKTFMQGETWLGPVRGWFARTIEISFITFGLAVAAGLIYVMIFILEKCS